MDVHSFDALSRRDATVPSRRRSLLGLGGAALASALVTPIHGVAKKKKKKKKGSDCKQAEQQRCSKDVETCKSTVALICQLDPLDCFKALDCCDACSASGFVTCLLDDIGA